MVLKPVASSVEHSWVCDVYAGWDNPAVRVPRPVAASDGAWVNDGWAAHVFVAGREASIARDAAAVREASDAFHDTISHLPRPGFLDDRHDPWTRGDRVAWDGAPPEGSPETLELLTLLLDVLQLGSSASQVIHADIGGNVLVGADVAPAVIDWPVYFRPRGFALAVAAVDAVCWEGLPASFLDAWADTEQWPQLLARALIYRIATVGRTETLGVATMPSPHHAARVRPSVDAVLARAR